MAVNVDKIGVHVTHCCVIHGCKYGENNCVVTQGTHVQAYLCEFCSNVLEEVDEVVEEIRRVTELKRNLSANNS